MTNIFILNWESAESVRECIKNIQVSSEPDFRIILINNFSTAIDLEEIRNTYGRVRDEIEIYLVENGTNQGYAGGNNAGYNFLIKNKLQGDVLILNPDILISGNTISEMNKALTGNIGIVSVRTMNASGKIIFDAIRLKGFLQKSIITDQQYIETDYAQGSCMLIRRELIDQIGLFDERFFLYWEEVDFSLRVKEAGWKLISITTTYVIRKINSITRQPLAFYYSVRNARLISDKHPGLFSKRAYALYLNKIFLLIAKFIFKPKLFLSVLSNYFSAIHDSFHNIYYSKPQKPGIDEI